jgi:hypothetical protein
MKDFEVLTAAVYEKFYPLDYHMALSVESQPTFRRNMSLPSSVSENKTNKKPA